MIPPGNALSCRCEWWSLMATKPPLSESARPSKGFPAGWTVKDQVVTANESWFGGAAIEHALRKRRDSSSSGSQQAPRHAPSEPGHGSSEGAHDQRDESATAEDVRSAHLAEHLLPCVFQGFAHDCGNIHVWPKLVA